MLLLIFTLLLAASAIALPYTDLDLAQNDYGNFGFPFSRSFYGRQPLPFGESVIGGHESGLGSLGYLYGQSGGLNYVNPGFYPGTNGYPDAVSFDQDATASIPLLLDGQAGGVNGGFPLAAPIASNPSVSNLAGLLGTSSANAVGGGTIGAGLVNTNNVAFTNLGLGFSNSQTRGTGNNANIFSVATSSQR